MDCRACDEVFETLLRFDLWSGRGGRRSGVIGVKRAGGLNVDTNGPIDFLAGDTTE